MYLRFPAHLDTVTARLCNDLDTLFNDAIEAKLQFMQMRGITDPYELAQFRQDYINEHLVQQQALLDKCLDIVPAYLSEHTISDDEFEQAWMLMGGIWNQLEFERIRSIVKLQYDYPEILKMAKILGRIADDEGKEKLPIGSGNTMSMDHSAPSDIEGITVGNDITSLLPSELAQMTDNDLSALFAYKFATRKLQTFRYKSQVLNPTHKLELHRARQNGPMVVCLDTSGSMSGIPERIAHSLIVKLLQIALKQDRDFLLIAFSVMAKPIDVRKNRSKLLEFFRKTSNGDTDANDMLSACIDTLFSREEYKSADVCLVSDYKMPLGTDRLMGNIMQLRDSGTRFYGLQIGEAEDNNWPKYFDQIIKINYKLNLRPSYIMK